MKVTEISTITNTFYVGLKDKSKIRVAGIIKSISDKETASGTAKRFKGDLAVESNGEVFQGRYGFFPTPIRDAILTAVSKIGKWSSFEFVLTASKTVAENGSQSWAVSFEVAPRVEMPRVLALLEE